MKLEITDSFAKMAQAPLQALLLGLSLLSVPLALFAVALTAQATPISSTDSTAYRAAERSKDSDINSTIKILFYYLQPPLEKAGSIDKLNELLSQQIEQANEIFAKSDIPVTFELAATNPWPFDTDEWETFRAKDIYKAMPPHVENIWANGLFHRVGADVMFLVDQRDLEDTHCGWATIDTEQRLRDRTSTRSYGIIRLGSGCGTDASVLAHEIGHLLGAAHGYGESLQASSYLGYGVRCAGKSTLMHPSFPKHDFVSTPDKTIGGEACGYQDAADNRQLFIERAPLLAAKVNEPSLSSSLTGDSHNHASLTLNSNLDPDHLLLKENAPTTSLVTTTEGENNSDNDSASSAGDMHQTAGSVNFSIFTLLILVILLIFRGTSLRN